MNICKLGFVSDVKYYVSPTTRIHSIHYWSDD